MIRPNGLLLLCILLATTVNAQPTEVANKANSPLLVATADGAPIQAKVPHPLLRNRIALTNRESYLSW